MAADQSNELKRLQNDAEYMHFLVAAGELLSSSLDYRSTLRNVCAAAVEAIADICILDLGSTADVERVGAAHRNSDLQILLEDLDNPLERDAGYPAHPVCRVLDTGKTFFAPSIDDDWIERNACSEKHASFMRRLEFRSMIIVPVRSQVWGLTGALTLVRTAQSERPYDDEAIIFAQDLGRRCGIAIGKARLHSQTVDIAERLQKAALPQSLPVVPDLRFDVLYEPADAALLVGGDWYDAFELRDGKIGMSIGDVSGHGIEAAAQMSSIRNAIRMALVMESDLTKVLADADFLFEHEVAEGTFCTALVAIIDTAQGTMTCASAGHPGPLIWTRGEIHTPLAEVAPPLASGRLSKESIRPVTVRLEPGCTVVLYTDGLIEWERQPVNGENALYRALHDPAVRNAVHPARALRDACILGAHADDLALLVFRYQRND
jgi:GAF domain-containing protein